MRIIEHISLNMSESFHMSVSAHNLSIIGFVQGKLAGNLQFLLFDILASRRFSLLSNSGML